MSTKRLQKTVIEGGRLGFNKYDRRNSNKKQRATERAYMAAVMKDLECYDEDMLEERDPVGKEFGDKLSPMFRWLDAQVGRKWSEVRSEVFKKFDTNTTAGRHITFDHLLRSVTDTLSGRDESGNIAENVTYDHFYVDGDDVLRKTKNKHKRWNRSWSPYYASKEELALYSKFLNGRMIGEVGGVLYWFTASDGIWKCEFKKEQEQGKYGMREGSLKLRYYSYEVGEHKVIEAFELSSGGKYYSEQMRTGLHWKYIKNPAGFKQRGKLTDQEAKYFKSFNEVFRNQALAFGKERS